MAEDLQQSATDLTTGTAKPAALRHSAEMSADNYNNVHVMLEETLVLVCKNKLSY